MSTLIDVKDIHKSYGRETVLERINLQIYEGQLFGLLGPSGSGKTTLVKMMIGLLEATSGVIYVQGKRMPNLNALHEVGYMAQSDALYRDLTARENLMFFASIYGISKRKSEKRIQQVADIVDLSDELDKRLELYSGGMLRRISLATALLHQPALLILDEPTVGIDPVLRASIWRELKHLQQTGTTIIVTTHVMSEAEKCDQLALLRDGRIIAEGSPATLMERSNKETLEGAFLYYGSTERKKEDNKI